MKNKDDAMQAGQESFKKGVYRGNSGLKGWRLVSWLIGWDKEHDSK